MDFEYPAFSFKGNNVKAMAAYRAALLSDEEPARRDLWIERLRKDYPNSEEARAVESRYGLAPMGKEGSNE
jgi:hypothetical protein